MLRGIAPRIVEKSDYISVIFGICGLCKDILSEISESFACFAICSGQVGWL